MKQMLYIIGFPGVGKSTVLEASLPPVVRQLNHPVKHVLYQDSPNPTIQLGQIRDGFAGTDALPMNAQPKVIDWLSMRGDDQLVIAEGDRLGNKKFFNAMTAAGWKLNIVMIAADDADVQARRDARGSDQNPVWLKGRETKVRNLRDSWFPDIIWNDSIENAVSTMRQQPAIMEAWRRSELASS